MSGEACDGAGTKLRVGNYVRMVDFTGLGEWGLILEPLRMGPRRITKITDFATLSVEGDFHYWNCSRFRRADAPGLATLVQRYRKEGL